MPDWISHEPVAWATLVGLVVDCAIVFGVPITTEQKTVVVALVSALFAVFVRSKVTPTAKIDQVPVAKQALEAHEAM
jgi:hypothetical protein